MILSQNLYSLKHMFDLNIDFVCFYVFIYSFNYLFIYLFIYSFN